MSAAESVRRHASEIYARAPTDNDHHASPCNRLELFCGRWRLMDHEAKSDQDCVQRVQAGETDAFERLVRRHGKKIFNLLYRWLGDYDEAAEAAHEVVLAAYRS